MSIVPLTFAVNSLDKVQSWFFCPGSSGKSAAHGHAETGPGMPPARTGLGPGGLRRAAPGVADDRPYRRTLRLEAGVVGTEGVDHVLERVGVVREGDVIARIL